MAGENLRDEAAHALHPEGWYRNEHPVPPLDSLEAPGWAMKAIREAGWEFQRKTRGDGHMLWIASKGHPGYGEKSARVEATRNDGEDLMRLLLAILTPTKEPPC